LRRSNRSEKSARHGRKNSAISAPHKNFVVGNFSELLRARVTPRGPCWILNTVVNQCALQLRALSSFRNVNASSIKLESVLPGVRRRWESIDAGFLQHYQRTPGSHGSSPRLVSDDQNDTRPRQRVGLFSDSGTGIQVASRFVLSLRRSGWQEARAWALRFASASFKSHGGKILCTTGRKAVRFSVWNCLLFGGLPG